MNVKSIHSFNVYNESEFINIQNELKKKIVLRNSF